MQGIYYLAEKGSYVDPYGDNIWQRFVEGGITTALLGILTVFAVLSIIWGCLEIFKYVFYTLPEKRKKEEAEESALAPAVQSVQPTAPAPVYSDDKAVVAAIIAAITAAREDEGIPSSVPFRVVSFKKKK